MLSQTHESPATHSFFVCWKSRGISYVRDRWRGCTPTTASTTSRRFVVCTFRTRNFTNETNFLCPPHFLFPHARPEFPIFGISKLLLPLLLSNRFRDRRIAQDSWKTTLIESTSKQISDDKKRGTSISTDLQLDPQKSINNEVKDFAQPVSREKCLKHMWQHVEEHYLITCIIIYTLLLVTYKRGRYCNWEKFRIILFNEKTRFMDLWSRF